MAFTRVGKAQDLPSGIASNQTSSIKLCKNSNEWWKNNVIYEVYTRSFCDSNGDGIGDLNGIISKLDYLVHLGVGTLWLTPFYPSPMVDFGYDISNFYDIDPIFGSMDDFKRLMSSMKDKGLKLVVDFVPNHTSDQHEWFKKSVKKEEPYTDYYVWKSVQKRDSGGKPIPPNNWKSVFGGSAWEYNSIREEFYLHQFAIEQPDLNFRNEKVLKEMHDVLDFWLELGVDGFRVDAAPHLLEDFGDPSDVKDVPLSSKKYNSSRNQVCKTNVPGNIEIIETFRKVCDAWSAKTGQERVLMTEGYLDIEELMQYYGTKEKPIAHFSFNFNLLKLDNKSSGFDVYKIVTYWFANLPKDCWSNWQIGNHDQPRAGDRFGEDSIDMLNMINLLLPGTAVTYYGEEIGMMNTSIKWEETVDPAGRNQGPVRFKMFSRDPERTPMQWSKDTNAGFTEGPTTWLPVNSNYSQINVQTETFEEESHLNVFKDLISARKSDAWKYGGLELVCLNGGAVFAFTRLDMSNSKSALLVVTNFSKEKVVVDTSSLKKVPEMITILTKSVNCISLPVQSTSVSSKSIPLDGRTGAVFRITLSSLCSIN